ncbi:hypothetical protein Taro_002524 [Colocasia esculenta]|uniref:Mitochondrial outer membrane protein porin 5 n=1 Tax=Colocasia esculenta TaxID=4460 RepID=A0A843TGU5_COLES|nr:hypothetical protein [Colocasia esculenta]
MSLSSGVMLVGQSAGHLRHSPALPTKTRGLGTNAVKKGGLYIGDITSQYKYKNTTIDIKVDTESKVSSTITLVDLLPFTKTIANVRLPDYNSGKLEVQYFHDHASIAGVVALKQSPSVDISGTFGSHGIVFGAEAGFDTGSRTFTKYNVGLSLTKSSNDETMLISIKLCHFFSTRADKGETLRASYVRYIHEKQTCAGVAEITRKFSTNENTLTVGGLCELDPLTTVKAKLNNNGKLAALLQHQLKPNNVLTISGEFDTKALDKHPRVGLSVAIRP